MSGPASGYGPSVTPADAAPPPDPGEASSLADIVDELDRAGYHGQWRALDGGRIECLTCRSIFRAIEVKADTVRRVEGASDPDDEAIAIGLICPVCGTWGTLIASYGPEASVEDADVLAALAPKRN